MMGLGAFGYLAGLTAVGVAVMVAGLRYSSMASLGVASVWWSLLAFHAVLMAGQLAHHLRLGPLAVGARPSAWAPAAPAEPDGTMEAVECSPVPLVGEVCVSMPETEGR